MLDYFFKLMDKRIDQVKSNPMIAPVLTNTEYRKLVVHKNISVFYTLALPIVKILLVWDNRQDPKKLKKKLLAAKI